MWWLALAALAVVVALRSSDDAPDALVPAAAVRRYGQPAP